MKSKMCILIIMIIFILLGITNFKSMASTSANILVESKDVFQGDTVEVKINLQNSIDFSAGNFTVRYDSSILGYEAYEVGNSLKNDDGEVNGTLLINKNVVGELRIGYIAEADQTSETKPQGTLITLKFKVNSGKVSSTDIILESTTLKKDDGTDIETNITNGKLRIASEIKINKQSLDLKAGNSEILSVSTAPILIDIPKEKITWKSANPEIATVDEQGKVTAVASGTTEITATVGTKTAKCTVRVPLG